MIAAGAAPGIRDRVTRVRIRAGTGAVVHPPRGNAVATSIPSRTVQPVQEIPLHGTIWTRSDTTSAPLARLRALSGVCRVGVRVSLGALQVPYSNPGHSKERQGLQ